MPASDHAVAGHDIVVMGASAGGIPPIQRVLSALPSGFPASIFVTIHTAAEGPGLLAEIFSRTSALPADYAKDGGRIAKARIYIAPPDRHMLLDDGLVRVTAGPRENRHRPAIDPLFRSAARAYGSRVIAVLLSGLLDDGSGGIKAVGRAGGISIVQDPREARFSSMPRNAVKNDSPSYVLPVGEIAARLIELVNAPAPAKGRKKIVRSLTNETKLAELDMSAIEADKAGVPSAYVCPECNGTLFEIKEGELAHFRCRVGHAYGAESLLVSKTEELEGALWTAMRTLEEKAALYRNMGERAQGRRNTEVSRRFRHSAEDMQHQAQTIRDLLLEREEVPLTGTDG